MTYQIKKPTSHNWLSHKNTYKIIIKQAIIKLALYDLLPISLTTWLIKIARLCHE
ncbi:hypothetical protein SAMN06296008_108141 [Polynucleobacter kasalickyi]|uniref:Uncharacterized protein n=1 Tax=Polynucleobacter kasalickyi TaxID=1938817 RepID=A0A1W2AGW3_9BURK|nr:hypothetical protein SAMN06296008_108141 [Polynucleobacter kasalickyi]